MNDRDRKRHERRKERQAAAALNRPIPPVAYPVWWPADASPEDVVGYVWKNIEKHNAYNAAVVVQARRRGWDGFLHCGVGAPQTVADAPGVVSAICTAVWSRATVLRDGGPVPRLDAPPIGPRDCPAIVEFMIAVENDGGAAPQWSITSAVRCVVDAERVRQLERMAAQGNDGVVALDIAFTDDEQEGGA